VTTPHLALFATAILAWLCTGVAPAGHAFLSREASSDQQATSETDGEPLQDHPPIPPDLLSGYRLDQGGDRVREDYGFVQATTLWPLTATGRFGVIIPSHRNIPVCWENPTRETISARNLVRTAIQESWEAVSGLRFIGWSACSPNARAIRIQMIDHGLSPRVEAFGARLYTTHNAGPVRNGMQLNPALTLWRPGRCVGNEDFCIQAIAVHEFGHALGFAHEQLRPDMSNRVGDCRRQTAAPEHNGEIGVGTSPDLFLSIMSECAGIYSVDRSNHLAAVNNGQRWLSPTDICMAQAFYCRPDQHSCERPGERASSQDDLPVVACPPS